MLDLNAMRDILANCAFPAFRFQVVHDPIGKIYLQAETDTVDLDTGEPWPNCRGRKWYLSPHMTKSELVATAFKAVLTFQEHEAREQFTYRGRRVFGPHIDIDALHEVAERTDPRT